MPNSKEHHERGMVVAAAGMDDIAEMVEIHVIANPRAYLTSLGEGFLRAMYSVFVKNSDSIALVAKEVESGKVAGVAIGCIHPRKFYWKLAIGLCPHYLSAWIHNRFSKGIQTVGATKRFESQGKILPRQNVAYFTQLNVSPEFQRRRVGSLLAADFYRAVLSKGITRTYLITDKDNDRVRALHEKMGCILVKEFLTPSGVKRCLYRKDLP